VKHDLSVNFVDRVVRDLARISMRGKPVLAFTNDLRGQATPTPVSLQQV